MQGDNGILLTLGGVQTSPGGGNIFIRVEQSDDETFSIMGDCNGSAYTILTASGGYVPPVEEPSSEPVMPESEVFSCGVVLVSSGIYSSSVITSATIFVGYNVDSAHEITVYSGGTAESTTVNSGGDLTVSSGGTAKYTIVNSGGRIYIDSGGTANDTIVNSGGELYVSSGGTALAVTSHTGAVVSVYEGGNIEYI